MSVIVSRAAAGEALIGVPLGAGFMLLWRAIGCGLAQRHGHSILCTLGVVIAIASFDIATKTWKRAQTASGEIRRR